MAASGLHKISSLVNSSFINTGMFSGTRTLQAVQCISTTAVCLKKTPRTVGVPAWAKAAQRRRRSLSRLGKPKTIEHIQAESLLGSENVKLDFFTSTRNKRPQIKTQSMSEFSLTKDQQAFVCYHPTLQDTKALLFSKEATEAPWWHLTTDEVKQFKDTLEPEEIEEAKQLRQKDPKLWSVNALSRLFSVKPLTIALHAPLTKDQKYEIEVERKLVHQWSDYKRKEYRAHQELERQRYVAQTRGQAMHRHLGIKE